MMQSLDKAIVSVTFFVCLSLHAHFDINKYINENRNSPEKLRDLLIDMSCWREPNLVAAKKILKLGVSANAEDSGNILCDNPGCTAITNASAYGKIDFVKLLLDYNADTEIKDPWDHRTPLMAAALYGHNDIVALLLDRGAQVNATNRYNTTSLIWAASEGNLETITLLLNAKADVTIKDNEGRTALKEAKRALFSEHQAQYDQIIKLLENAGAQE